jgi:hypothetical protein
MNWGPDLLLPLLDLILKAVDRPARLAEDIDRVL